jgi:hypothetical protein
MHISDNQQEVIRKRAIKIFIVVVFLGTITYSGQKNSIFITDLEIRSM